MWMITGSGFKPIALHVNFPKSFALGVMGKMVFPVFCSVPSGHFQATSGCGNPRTGQQIVVDTPLLALWFVLGHTSKFLLTALCSKREKYIYISSENIAYYLGCFKNNIFIHVQQNNCTKHPATCTSSSITKQSATSCHNPATSHKNQVTSCKYRV